MLILFSMPFKRGQIAALHILREWPAIHEENSGTNNSTMLLASITEAVSC